MSHAPAEVARFIDACAAGDVEAVRAMLIADPSLVHATDHRSPHAGWAGLHAAARGARLDVTELLLEHSADPNAREAGDNTSPLFWAAATGQPDLVRALLDAGADPTAAGDAHALDVIGWGSFYHAAGEDASSIGDARREMLNLLVERGARHHIFSAIAVGDIDVIREVAARPGGLDRRMSRFEEGQSPLHFAANRRRYDILSLLIDLGADPNATDAHGRTVIETAMLRGDREAMVRLKRAGAALPQSVERNTTAALSALAGSITAGVPMLAVPDVAATLAWYRSIGFEELERYDENGLVNFGVVGLGNARLMLTMHGAVGRHDTSIWLYTNRVDEIYDLLRSKQLAYARAVMDGRESELGGVEIDQDIADMFYGARQFCIRDLNGYQIYFIQLTGSEH